MHDVLWWLSAAFYFAGVIYTYCALQDIESTPPWYASALIALTWPVAVVIALLLKM